MALNEGGRTGATWLIVAAAVAMLVALAFSAMTAPPKSPFYGRMAELIEVLLVVALVPLIAAVMGLVGLVRGLGG